MTVDSNSGCLDREIATLPLVPQPPNLLAFVVDIYLRGKGLLEHVLEGKLFYSYRDRPATNHICRDN